MSWLKQFFSRQRFYGEIALEIREQIDERIEELVAEGMPKKEAGAAARREFGNVTLIEEDSRAIWQWPTVESFLSDVRYGVRMLRTSPGFTVVAVLTVALGIGANTAMFSVVEGVLLSPLQYFQPDRLVMVWENNPRFPRVWVSYPNFLDWQRTAHSFQQMAAGMEQGVDLIAPGTPEHLNGEEISSGFFRTLGVELALGREFFPQEDRRGGNPVAIISNRLWRNRFDSNPEVLGKYVTLDGVDYTVVGVVPSGFGFGHQYADVYTPLGRSDPLILNDRSPRRNLHLSPPATWGDPSSKSGGDEYDSEWPGSTLSQCQSRPGNLHRAT